MILDSGSHINAAFETAATPDGAAPLNAALDSHMEQPEHADTITGYYDCVFAAPTSDSLPVEPVYLRREPEARVVESLLGPVYESDGIGITASDDELVPPEKLAVLASAVVAAIAQVKHKPESWPVYLGHRFLPVHQEVGEPIYGTASRQCLLDFLDQVLTRIDSAKRNGHCIQWGGG